MVREMCLGCEKRTKDVIWPKETDHEPYCGRCRPAYIAGRHNGVIVARGQLRTLLYIFDVRDTDPMEMLDRTKGERRAYRRGYAAGERLFKKTIRDWLDVHSKRGVEDLLDLRMR